MARITAIQHSRRTFLRSAAALAAAPALGRLSGAERDVLADLDVFEARLTAYARHVRAFTTPWGETVDDWYDAFQAAIVDLRTNGGGRLIVPGGRKYPIRASVAFDLPVVSVHLERGSYVEKVGTPDVFLGAPLGFYGNAVPGRPIEERIQRDFAALVGPGAVGYPGDHVELFPHENGVGFSYIKNVLVDGIRVPFGSGKALTAQFGCDRVVFRNTVCGPTGQTDAERTWPGQSAVVVQGTFAPSMRPPAHELFGEFVLENNQFGASVRGIYVEFVKQSRIVGNTFGPTWGGGMQFAVADRIDVVDNRLTSISTGVQKNGFEFHGIAQPSLVANRLDGHAHKHAVLSAELPPYGVAAGVIKARHNQLAAGTDAIFAGTPEWDTR